MMISLMDGKGTQISVSIIKTKRFTSTEQKLQRKVTFCNLKLTRAPIRQMIKIEVMTAPHRKKLKSLLRISQFQPGLITTK